MCFERSNLNFGASVISIDWVRADHLGTLLPEDGFFVVIVCGFKPRIKQCTIELLTKWQCGILHAVDACWCAGLLR